MAHTFVIADFASNEEAAQQARQKVERWKQGFRLGNKLMVKFDRGEGVEKTGKEEGGKASGEKLVVMVRLDFSDHEKLSQQRWIDRIPAEAPFADAHPKVIRQGDQEFTSTSERFEAID